MTNKEAIEHLKNINSRYPCSLDTTFTDECEMIAINLAIKALDNNMTILVTLSDGYGHVREAYYDKGRQLVFTEYFSVKDLESSYININERKELSDNEDSQL